MHIKSKTPQRQRLRERVMENERERERERKRSESVGKRMFYNIFIGCAGEGVKGQESRQPGRQEVKVC